ncbi:hypothetical protein ACSBR1_014377 [Camellia fascicularis]
MELCDLKLPDAESKWCCWNGSSAPSIILGYSVWRDDTDNLKEKISPLLGLCIQAPRTSRASLVKGSSRSVATTAAQQALIAHWQGIVKSLGIFLNSLKTNHTLIRKSGCSEKCSRQVPVVLIGWHDCHIEAQIERSLDAHMLENEKQCDAIPAEKKKVKSTEPNPKKVKKEKKAKDPNQPKRPQTAFLLNVLYLPFWIKIRLQRKVVRNGNL